MNKTNQKRHRYGVAAAAAALVLSAPYAAHATDYTWNGGTGDGKWTTEANWMPMGVPGAQDTAYIGGSAAVQVPGNVTLQNLRLGADATILNDGALNVTGWTSSDGVLEGAGELSIPEGAAATINLSATLFAHNPLVPRFADSLCKKKGKKDDKVKFGKVKNKGKLKIIVAPSVDVEFADISNEDGETLLSFSGSASDAPLAFKKLKNIKGRLTMSGPGADGRAFECEDVSNNAEMIFSGVRALAKKDYSNERGAKMSLKNGSLLACSSDVKKLENEGVLEAMEGDSKIAMEWKNKGGHLRVGTGRLTIAPPNGKKVTQDAGTTTIDGGTLEIVDSTTKPEDKGLLIKGGVLDGSGTIEGDVTIDGGTLSVGHSPGLMVISGNYTQTANGLMQMEIWGPAPGYLYDQLRVNGIAYLNGTLNVEYGNNYAPNQNSFFHMTYAYYIGNFSRVNFVNPIPGKYYRLNYGTTMVYSQIFSTPLPGTTQAVASAYLTDYQPRASSPFLTGA